MTCALVMGGVASGKSAFAQQLALELAQGCGGHSADRRCVYLATMARDGSQQARGRIARHEQLRRELPFELWECTHGIAGDSGLIHCTGATVLVEGLGTLLANSLFDPACPACMPPWDSMASRQHQVYQQLLQDVGALRDTAAHLVLVSDILSPSWDTPGTGSGRGQDTPGTGGGRGQAQKTVDPGTAAYCGLLSMLNSVLAAECQLVYEVVCGIPVPLKDGLSLIHI